MVAVADDAGQSDLVMNVLFWRGWRPAFNEGVTYATLHGRGIGGTEMQMLCTPSISPRLGTAVQILGATCADALERGVNFIGASDRSDQAATIASGRVGRPDLILLGGAYHAASILTHSFPGAVIVHVGQNIDAYADRVGLAEARCIDLNAFLD